MRQRIFDIQRFSIHDGPGIRTTVFMKGCPLRCLWCSNPESISPEPQLSYTEQRCIACGACFPACKPEALKVGREGKAHLEWPRCNQRLECVPTCDARALEAVGREVTTEEIMAVVLRDRDYYEASGGGMTLSGGDPLFNPGFCEALLCEARAHGIHACVETSGYGEWASIEPLVPLVDLWLYDFKETDPKKHYEFTGVSNGVILDNLKKLHAAGARILLRCPMIPGHNARDDHLDGIAAIAAELPHLIGVELLPYFDLWRGKLRRFGLTPRLPDSVKPPDRGTMDAWNAYLRRRGVKLAGMDAGAAASDPKP
ncbi:MAG TPA: glycyl-radical enzyme activating protein [Verrucomicrobiae bacterium]|nr:glycyl-radical enzyme activating protein [Verrucomicrobiae bacterium]